MRIRRLPSCVLAGFLAIALLSGTAAPARGGDGAAETATPAPKKKTPKPAPPAPPESGPGSAVGPHAAALELSYHSDKDTGYWLYEPDQPRAESAPVVVFLHGYGASNPEPYRAWIEHIVRRGRLVIYPRWQAGFWLGPSKFTPNALAAVKDALDRLQNEDGHTRPMLDKFAILGHSAGGTMTANLAAIAEESGLPVPRAIMPVCPGRSFDRKQSGGIPLADLSKIPRGTLMLSVCCEDDDFFLDTLARRFVEETTQVAPEDKNLVYVRSDHHGRPALIADHNAPGSFGGGDTLDTHGFWRLFDALTDTAFDGKDRRFCLGGTPEQKDMGTWSDGMPVEPLRVVCPGRKKEDKSGTGTGTDMGGSAKTDETGH